MAGHQPECLDVHHEARRACGRPSPAPSARSGRGRRSSRPRPSRSARRSRRAARVAGVPGGYQCFDERVVGPRARADADRGGHAAEPTGGPSRIAPDGCAPDRRLRLGSRRPHRPARVPRDDAERGLRLPRRPCAPARTARGRCDEIARFAHEIGRLPRAPGREADRRRVQRGDLGRAARISRRSSTVPVVSRDRPRGARGRAGDAQPPDRPARDPGDRDGRRYEPLVRTLDAGVRSPRSPARSSCR